jgi:hypothetical protein
MAFGKTNMPPSRGGAGSLTKPDFTAPESFHFHSCAPPSPALHPHGKGGRAGGAGDDGRVPGAPGLAMIATGSRTAARARHPCDRGSRLPLAWTCLGQIGNRARCRLNRFAWTCRHGRHRVVRVVAVSAAIGDPAGRTAVGHGHRHPVAAGRHHGADRCRADDRAKPCRSTAPGAIASGRRPGCRTCRSSRAGAHLASWKITPTVWRRPDRSRLTPCRRFTR